MSRATAQLRTFEMLWDELRPHVATDRNLPARIQQRLAKEKRFGSRDRRLYRELLYTALRHLPWMDGKSIAGFQPVGSSTTILWLSADTPATLPLKRELLASAPPCPATVSERAALLGKSVDALFPAWFRAHCPAAFSEPNITALHTRAPLWLRLQTDDPAPVFAEFAARGWTWRQAEESGTGFQPVIPATPNPTAWKPVPLQTDALELVAANDPDLTQTDAYRRGLIEIQDLGSQLVIPTALANLPVTNRWLDACAGAGGKTLQLAGILGSNAQIDATDPRPAALAELSARAARARLKNIRAVSQSALAPDYDGVLVDAPCSGTGTWRRNPHLKYCTPESAIHAAAKLQIEILARHATLVRANGGALVYATCSLSRVENENVVGAFLADAAHRDFSLVRQGTILPAENNTDGFFVATLRRGGF